MEAAAKDTLELQSVKDSEVNKINIENERIHNVKPKPREYCYRCGNSTHESRMKHAGNVKNWTTSNEFAALEEIRILPDELRMINSIYIL